MYETTFEPLGKNHWTYAPWPDVRPLAGRLPLFGPINRTLPPRIFHSFRTPLGYQFVSKVFSKLVSVGECVCVQGVCEFGAFVKRNSRGLFQEGNI
jgi:hypothetical protein